MSSDLHKRKLKAFEEMKKENAKVLAMAKENTKIAEECLEMVRFLNDEQVKTPEDKEELRLMRAGYE